MNKPYCELPVQQGRALISAEARIFGKQHPIETVRDITIPGGVGDIPARLYRPAGIEGPSAALVYFHGGGWVLGDLATADTVSRFLAHHAALTVISIDYRLAPEHPFPAGLQDALAAFNHVATHPTDYNIDPNAVGVGGESAGGNLTAVIAQQTALAARSEPTPTPAFQLLFMPVTDLSTRHDSYGPFGDGLFLTAGDMDWYRDHYLTDPTLVKDPRVSPCWPKTCPMSHRPTSLLPVSMSCATKARRMHASSPTREYR